jgi:DNA repair exonuclease SbcCD nuclease subunit
MDFKFVHAADLHLDSPLQAVPAEGPLRSVFEGATLVAFSRIIDFCLAESVQFLLLAGDLYEFNDRSVRARLALHRGLERLDEAGIQSFIVHGNHDPLSSEDGMLSLPASAKVFGADWEEVEVRRSGMTLCRIQGLSHPHERVSENLAQRFSRKGPEFTIGLLHANLGSVPAHPNYAPCRLADLSAAQLDYWALGHVHSRAEYELPNGGVAVYPGNPQGRNSGEPGERGCVLVEVREGRSDRRFCAMDVVRWDRAELDVSKLSSLDALASSIQMKLESSASRSTSAATVEGHASRVVLVGPTALHPELAQPGALAELEDHVRSRLVHRSGDLVLESLQDRTGPPMDLEKLASIGTLGGAVASAFKAAQMDRGPCDGLWADEKLSQLEASLRREGLCPTRERAAELLGRAYERALELLGGEAAG